MSPDRRPRVCVISHTYVQATKRRKLHYLAQHADVLLVVPREFPEPPYGVYQADAGDGSYPVQRVRTRFLNPGFSSTRYVFLSTDLGIKAFRPDIIQVENEIHSFATFQSLAARRLYAPAAKVVVAFWQNLETPGVRGATVRALQRLAMPHIDFYAPANDDGAAIVRGAGVPTERIQVFPPIGVEPDEFRPLDAAERRALRAGLGIASDAFVVGYCGRLVPEKGIGDVLDALSVLGAAREPWHLMVIGSGPLEDEVRRRTAAMGLAATVLRGLPYQDVARHLAAFDALVLPSRTTPWWKEQFGRVLVEAMACEVPIVAADSGTIPQVVGPAGLIFPEGDAPAMARHLQTLRADPVRRDALVAAGRARVRAEYSNEHIAARSLDIYRVLSS